MSFWNRKTFCVISGASRGFGASMALTFANHLTQNSVLVLIARNGDKLTSVKQNILSKRSDLKVFTWDMDLVNAEADDFNKRFTDLFSQDEECNPQHFSQCLIVHNAGTIGTISVPLTKMINKKDIDKYWSLNLTSVILLNSVFFGFFDKSLIPHRYAIQISSLAAIKPVLYWDLYSGGKAARDMMFKAMSEEEEIRVLSYAPGPLRTDMFQEAVQFSGHPNVKTTFEALDKDGALTCEQSSRKLVNVLRNDTFKSGRHLDYFDFDEEGLLISSSSQ